jgi:hypothetical protein
MYVQLFNLAGLAIIGWVLMIVFPWWSWTKRLARSAAAPVYLAALYVIGVVPLFIAAGPGIMREFVTPEGVVRLLSNPDAALVVWIHILVFDQLAGILIFRDNLRERVVPIPVQSAILFLTLMFGPVGFLLYYGIRVARKKGPALLESGA